MKKQTPLAKAIEEIRTNENLSDLKKVGIIHILQKYLGEEKQMVMDAFNKGKFETLAFKSTPKEEYFNENYQQ